MSATKPLAAAALAAALMGVQFAHAEQGKFDHKVAEAAANKAAEKIGAIRGSIDHDTKPAMTVEEAPKQTSRSGEGPERISSNTLEHWQPPEPETGPAPLLAESQLVGVDRLVTTSIPASGNSQIILSTNSAWQKYDRNGRAID